MSEELKILKGELARLTMLEKQMARMRNDCEQKVKLWEAANEEIDTLEERAVIYRYRLQPTQEEELTKKE